MCCVCDYHRCICQRCGITERDFVEYGCPRKTLITNDPYDPKTANPNSLFDNDPFDPSKPNPPAWALWKGSIVWGSHCVAIDHDKDRKECQIRTGNSPPMRLKLAQLSQCKWAQLRGCGDGADPAPLEFKV